MTQVHAQQITGTKKLASIFVFLNPSLSSTAGLYLV